MGDADYRKINDRSHNSSTYHKKDGTCVRAVLKEEARREIMEHVSSTKQENDNERSRSAVPFKSDTCADLKQMRGLVNERNDYRQLLDECRCALNQLPNTPISGGNARQSTYELAAAIGATFRQFDGLEDDPVFETEETQVSNSVKPSLILHAEITSKS